MGWKKVADSKDLIVFEKQYKKCKVKIEARKNDDLWEVFKTKVDGKSSNLISEYFLENKYEVNNLIEKRKKEKITSGLKVFPIKISLKRIHKEEFIEKWNLIIEKGVSNFFYVKYDESIFVDIVLHEKYKYYQHSIILQVEEKLGLKDLGDVVSYNVYYYKKHEKEKKRVNYDLVDIEFDFSDYGNNL